MNKVELQEEMSRLMLEQQDKVFALSALRDKTNAALNELLTEIAKNPNTPPEILELARNYVQASQADFLIADEALGISQKITKVREALFAID